MIKCIIFDMDGVLINTEPLHFRLWQQVFRERGVPLDYDHYKGCIGSTADYLFDLILEGYGRDFHNDPTITARFRELKQFVLKNEGLPRIDGVPEVLCTLHSSGYRLAVASSSPQDVIEQTMNRLGISHYFDLLFSAERVKRPKPAPDVFLETALRLQMNPEECLVVEDSRNGSLAAKSAGMMCLGFQNPDSGCQDLSAADQTFYPFCELAALVGRNPSNIKES
ncbi:MAG: HAD family phosphatase [Candidatus Choladocola sp.]|nr:HAD family phosphatase [Candidatus Choladocola sp.]